MLHGLLFVTFFRALLEAAPVEISGYIGDTVTLPLGDGSLLNLVKVEWSIFANTTLIATYDKGKTKVDWFYQYAGRLSLNITTGDLTIRELQMDDALAYHVEFFEHNFRTNNVQLVVKQQLKKPIIKIVSTSKEDSLWWLVLHCSSPHEGVDFTWQVKPPRIVVFKSIIHNNNSSAALAALNTTQDHVEITCTSSRSTENTSSVIIPKLVEEKAQSTSSGTDNTRCRNVVPFLLGFLLASTLMAILRFMVGKIRSRAQSEPKTNSFEINSS